MPPEPAFIMGLMLGTFGVLIIQSLIKSRVKKALAKSKPDPEISDRDEQIAHLRDRVAVMERIAVDKGVRVADEIEQLRQKVDLEK